MTTLTVRLPSGRVNWSSALQDLWEEGRHPRKLRIRSVGTTDPRIGGVKPLIVPFAPIESTESGLAPTFTRTTRPGRPDAVARATEPTPTLAFDLFFAHRRYDQSVEGLLAHLRRLVAHDDAVILQGYGPAEVGPWYIDSCSIKRTDRVPGTNEASAATATITFVKATEGSVRHGPLSTTYNSGHGTQVIVPDSKTYTVRKGDTLHSIAKKVYHDADVAYLLGALNGIKNVRKELKPGKVIKTPRLEDTLYGVPHG